MNDTRPTDDEIDARVREMLGFKPRVAHRRVLRRALRAGLVMIVQPHGDGPRLTCVLPTVKPTQA